MLAALRPGPPWSSTSVSLPCPSDSTYSETPGATPTVQDCGAAGAGELRTPPPAHAMTTNVVARAALPRTRALMDQYFTRPDGEGNPAEPPRRTVGLRVYRELLCHSVR